MDKWYGELISLLMAVYLFEKRILNFKNSRLTKLALEYGYSSNIIGNKVKREHQPTKV
jgi:hypothetical protein